VISVLYVLCALTSVLCTVLLARAFARTRARLLLWSALCFAGMALQNLVLLVDKATPMIDLSVPRTLPALIGVLVLLFGLVWDSR
jgi:hypothetical protein